MSSIDEGRMFAVKVLTSDEAVIGFMNDDGTCAAAGSFDLDQLVACRNMIDKAIQRMTEKETRQ